MGSVKGERSDPCAQLNPEPRFEVFCPRVTFAVAYPPSAGSVALAPCSMLLWLSFTRLRRAPTSVVPRLWPSPWLRSLWFWGSGFRLTSDLRGSEALAFADLRPLRFRGSVFSRGSVFLLPALSSTLGRDLNDCYGLNGFCELSDLNGFNDFNVLDTLPNLPTCPMDSLVFLLHYPA